MCARPASTGKERGNANFHPSGPLISNMIEDLEGFSRHHIEFLPIASVLAATGNRFIFVGFLFDVT